MNFINVRSRLDGVYPAQTWSQTYVGAGQSNAYYNIGNVGIGQAIPENKLVVDGNCSIGSSPYSATVAPVDGLIIKGNVGIGTTNPLSKLHVVGDLRVNNDVVVGGALYATFGGNGSALTNLQRTALEGFALGQIPFGTGTYPTQSANLTYDATTGLYVNNHLTLGGTKTFNGNGQGITNLQRTNMTGFDADQILTGNGTYPYSSANLTYNSTTGLYVNNDAIITGNTILQGDLTVNGTMTTINTDTIITDQLIVENAGTGSALIVKQTGVQPIFECQDDGTTVFKIIDGGNVGIGITLPTATLHVSGTLNAGATTLASLQNNGNATITGTLNAGATTLASLQNNGNAIISGNVGINTSSPTERLYVVGNGILSGSFTAGSGTFNSLTVNGSASIISGLTVGNYLTAYPRISIVEEQVARGASAPSSVVGWGNVRQLNTYTINILGLSAPSAGVISLPAGTYHIRASAPAFYDASRHKIRLYNVSTSAVLLGGTNAYVGGNTLTDNRSFIDGIIVLSATNNIRIDHYVETSSGASNRLGIGGFAVASDLPEVFAVMSITKYI